MSCNFMLLTLKKVACCLLSNDNYVVTDSGAGSGSKVLFSSRYFVNYIRFQEQPEDGRDREDFLIVKSPNDLATSVTRCSE